MIYLLYGKSDERKKYIRKISEKNTVILTHVYDYDISEESIHTITNTQKGLFGDIECYVLHNLSRGLDLESLLPEYSESDNIFIFSEDSITKPITKVFETHIATIKDFGKEILVNNKNFVIFSLADAFGSRDKKQLWLQFQQVIKYSSPEEIHGILFWQIKNLALIYSSEYNPGMSPFVYKKNVSFAQNFSKDEIKTMARKFIHMFHNRNRYNTLDIEIEKFILSL